MDHKNQFNAGGRQGSFLGFVSDLQAFARKHVRKHVEAAMASSQARGVTVSLTEDPLEVLGKTPKRTYKVVLNFTHASGRRLPDVILKAERLDVIPPMERGLETPETPALPAISFMIGVSDPDPDKESLDDFDTHVRDRLSQLAQEHLETGRLKYGPHFTEGARRMYLWFLERGNSFDDIKVDQITRFLDEFAAGPFPPGTEPEPAPVKPRPRPPVLHAAAAEPVPVRLPEPT